METVSSIGHSLLLPHEGILHVFATDARALSANECNRPGRCVHAGDLRRGETAPQNNASAFRLTHVSLTWGEIKRLVRLQAVAEQLAVIARENQDAQLSRGPGGSLLDELIDETREVLKAADEDLAEEFERIVGESTDTWLSLAVRASVLAGWLDGTVAAETLEVRIRTGVGGGRLPRASTRHNGG
jgi:hypothetical protein